MRRLAITTAVLLSTVVTASADRAHFFWHDTIRPHGHARSATIFNASVNGCNERAGEQDEFVSLAFKACMRDYGYRYMYRRVEHTPVPTGDRSVVIYNRDSADPHVGWHTDENGFRQCEQDCDNPEIPGSGYVCRNVEVMGMPMRQCDK